MTRMNRKIFCRVAFIFHLETVLRHLQTARVINWITKDKYDYPYIILFQILLWMFTVMFFFTLISVFVDENNGHVNRLLGFSVYVSNTTNKEDGSFCFYDDNVYTPSTIPGKPTLNCKMHGRYVIHYNERKQGQPPYYSSEAFVDLCEFEVYGTH